MPHSHNADAAARVIAAAVRSKTRLTALDAGVRPATLDEGYDIQDALIAELADPVTGWKLGQGSPKGLRSAGLERALVGRVTASRCHAAKSTITLAVAAPVTVEIEIAFRLACDIAPSGSLPSPRDVIAGACLAAEIILSRFVDRKAVGLPSYLAENVGFEALVIGQPVEIADLHEIMSTVVVDLDGKRIADAQTGEDAIDPFRAVEHLIAHARARGMTLHHGDLVSTGTISKPFDCAGSRARIVARVGGHELPFNLVWP